MPISTRRTQALGRTQALAGDPDLATAAEALDRCGDVLKHMAGTQLDPERLAARVAERRAELELRQANASYDLVGRAQLLLDHATREWQRIRRGPRA